MKKLELGKDKIRHASVSFLIAFFIGIFYTPLIGFIAALVIGGGKEIYDSFHPERNDCELMDFVADIIGALFGVGMLYLII